MTNMIKGIDMVARALLLVEWKEVQVDKESQMMSNRCTLLCTIVHGSNQSACCFFSAFKAPHHQSELRVDC